MYNQYEILKITSESSFKRERITDVTHNILISTFVRISVPQLALSLRWLDT